MQKPLAKWNPSRDVWELEATAPHSEHSDVFSATWPISGSMRNGEASKLPTSELPTSVCAYLFSPGTGSASPAQGSSRSDVVLFRTPCAAEVDGGALTPEQARERGQTLRLAGQVEAEFGDLRTLPTPTTSDGNGPGLHGSVAADLRTTVTMLPTPVAQPSGNTPEEHLRKKPGRRQVTDLAIIAEHDLFASGGRLPTPDATRGGSTTEAVEMLPAPKATDGELGLPRTDFGVYAAAVQRWEAVTGRPAPEPTKPNQKTGRRQLSAEFVEWMMGLPAGWVTDPDMGLTRRQKFRIAGNGVVPQQGYAALATMLDTAFTEEEERKHHATTTRKHRHRGHRRGGQRKVHHRRP